MSEPANVTVSSLYVFTGCSLLMAGVLLLDVLFPQGVAVDVLYIAPVLLALRTEGDRPAIVAASVCSVLVVAGYYLSTPGGDLWKILFNRGIAIAALWIAVVLGLRNKKLAAAREAALREREQAMEDAKVLRGLLPICAWCKKVRDDRGYWTQIEAYIASHSDASFSHGICPECMAKHYPGVHRKKTDRSGGETP